MNRFFGICLTTLAVWLAFACRPSEKADLIIYNAKAFTVNQNFDTVEAFAIKDGKILETGTSEFIRNKYKAENQIDADGKTIYPGFIDSHCHFVGYASFLKNVDLTGSKSFTEVINRLKEHRKIFPEDAWLKGRGWDQNLWTTKEFPSNDSLTKLFPDVPVLITRIDGHAALVNEKALKLAGISPDTKIEGGLVEAKNGKLTGILIDNAVDLVNKVVPAPNKNELRKALKIAEQNCFAVGLTTLVDAGLDKASIDLIDEMQQKGELQIRMNIMATPSDENKKHYFEKGPYLTDRLRVNSFKIYADGALGSRGACLLHPYHDQPGSHGLLLKSVEELQQIAKELYAHNFQMNTHAIGDSANRVMLDIYSNVLKGKNDRRWRIEHAQVVHPNDIQKFSYFSVIPSVQPTHATSDMSWAGERLGKERIRTAYAYKDLLQQNGLLAMGSDFPVEDINPIFGFHAAVARQNSENKPKNGFQMENAISRKDALKGMTIWGAYSCFEEKLKGSLEKGKFADFVILEEDIMNISPEKMRSVKVKKTFVNGKEVYSQLK